MLPRRCSVNPFRRPGEVWERRLNISDRGVDSYGVLGVCIVPRMSARRVGGLQSHAECTGGPATEVTFSRCGRRWHGSTATYTCYPRAAAPRRGLWCLSRFSIPGQDWSIEFLGRHFNGIHYITICLPLPLSQWGGGGARCGASTKACASASAAGPPSCLAACRSEERLVG
jgi:hypothetical protein